MKPLEENEVRGITIKQLITYIITVIAFVVTLVIRDVKRENKVEALEQKMSVIEIKLDAATKERDALKTAANTRDLEIMRLKTTIELKK